MRFFMAETLAAASPNTGLNCTKPTFIKRILYIKRMEKEPVDSAKVREETYKDTLTPCPLSRKRARGNPCGLS